MKRKPPEWQQVKCKLTIQEFHFNHIKYILTTLFVFQGTEEPVHLLINEHPAEETWLCIIQEEVPEPNVLYDLCTYGQGQRKQRNRSWNGEYNSKGSVYKGTHSIHYFLHWD